MEKNLFGGKSLYFKGQEYYPYRPMIPGYFRHNRLYWMYSSLIVDSCQTGIPFRKKYQKGWQFRLILLMRYISYTILIRFSPTKILSLQPILVLLWRHHSFTNQFVHFPKIYSLFIESVIIVQKHFESSHFVPVTFPLTIAKDFGYACCWLDSPNSRVEVARDRSRDRDTLILLSTY